jgi:hypothetical protein
MHHGFGNRRRCCTVNADSVALYDIVTQRDLSRLFSQLHLVTMKLPLLCNRSISSSSFRPLRKRRSFPVESLRDNFRPFVLPELDSEEGSTLRNPIFVRSFRVLPAAAYSSNWKI